MKVVLIEDEQLAAERLVLLLKQYNPAIEVVQHLFSIEESVQWMKTNTHPDLLFLDIQLQDGYCFEIFKTIDYRKPVIFTTAYNQYALEAFKLLSIDYLLKPITAEALSTAMHKFELMLTSAPVNYKQLSKAFDEVTFKSRFLAKAGQKMFFVEASEIQFFLADDKIVFLIDREGNKLMIDYTLEKLESILNPKEFFRINRKYLVRYSSITLIKPYVNSRLKILLRNGSKTEEVILSRERVPDFKCWAEA